MNKLGINEYKLLDVEKQIINLKLNMLDETFTFNNNSFDFKYLCALHKFLFNDFYNKAESGTRDLNEIEKDTIELYLKRITDICINNFNNIKELSCLITEIWHLQPFVVGNTRTMLAFLKVLKEAFLLDIIVDVNQNIVNNPTIFNVENLVNQKRLTKHK